MKGKSKANERPPKRVELPDREAYPTLSEQLVALSVIYTQGGYREKSLAHEPHTFKRSEEWNDEHKVVHVIADNADESGHHDSCAVDVVQLKIVG